MKRNNYIVILLLITAAVFFFVDFGDEKKDRSFRDLFGKSEPELIYHKLSGSVFGTFYHITYADTSQKTLQTEILKELAKFNSSLSTYDPNSTISKFNQSETGIISDEYLTTVFKTAQHISETTNGAFDMTVAPIVNYWGFGFTTEDVQHKQFQQSSIDSMLAFTGYDKVHLKNGILGKDFPQVELDASAIAKGFGVDVAGNVLADHGIKNYLVEIGGEVTTAGVNAKGQPWTIGINKPIDTPLPTDDELQAIVSISGKALASSGNYRQFYMKDGKKYSHTINPKTGYPVNHNLLASTVIADNCMTADAYATACMVLGVEESLKLAKSLPEIEVFLIFENEEHQLDVTYTDGFKKYLTK